MSRRERAAGSRVVRKTSGPTRRSITLALALVLCGCSDGFGTFCTSELRSTLAVEVRHAETGLSFEALAEQREGERHHRAGDNEAPEAEAPPHIAGN